MCRDLDTARRAQQLRRLGSPEASQWARLSLERYEDTQTTRPPIRGTSRTSRGETHLCFGRDKLRPWEGVLDRRCRDRNAERKIPGQFGVSRRAAERPLRQEGSIIQR